MLQPEQALRHSVDRFADQFRERHTFGLDTKNEGSAWRSHRDDVIAGIVKLLLMLSILVAVGMVSIYGVSQLGSANADMHSDAGAFTGEIRELASKVEHLSEQNTLLHSELALLTGSDGVLPKLIEKLRQQREVNAVHSNALRQLLSAKMVDGDAQLPSSFATKVQTPHSDGPLRVQVTPVGTGLKDNRTENEPYNSPQVGSQDTSKARADTAKRVFVTRPDPIQNDE